MRTKTEKLALEGGPKAIDFPLDEYLRWPPFGEEEAAAVKALVLRGETSISQETRTFEKEFAAYIGREHAVATNNGTSAIHSAMFAFGIRPGDEVICPSYTFWGSIVEAMTLGAVPVLADVDPDTAGIAPDEVERLITPRTKAVIAVHLWGMPAKIAEIQEICRRRGVFLMEDASHVHGATIDGRKAGSFSDIACFSLQSSKVCPAGEAGMLVTDDDDLFHRATFLGHYERLKELPEELASYAPIPGGFKYRMSPLAAAIGRIQLHKLDEMNHRRNGNVRCFEELLEKTGLFRPLPGYPGTERVYYENQVEFRHKEAGVSVDAFCQALSAEGLPSRPTRYPLLHKLKMFHEPLYLWGPGKPPVFPVMNYPKRGDEAFPVSLRFRDTMVTFPTFPLADEETVRRSFCAVEKVIANLDRLRKIKKKENR